MAKIIVTVMPKPVLLDPQGKAIAQALSRTGVTEFDDVRVDKTIELSVAGEVTTELRAKAEEVARDMFMNQELDYVSSVTVEEN